jgi:peptidoglycan-N-acetylglucosamine deacetylase
VGDNVNKHPDLFRRIRLEGHVTANHTMHHTKGYSSTVSEYLEEVDTCARLMDNRLFRPPYGRMRRAQYRALIDRGFRIVLWDVISYDYENISRERCVANVIRKTRAGSIVLFHDNVKAERNLRYTLPRVLSHFSKMGFRFSALAA